MGGFVYLGTVLVPEGANTLVSAAYPVVGGMIGAIIGFAVIYLAMLIKAPTKQRNEARRRVGELSEKRKPHFEVHPITGKRAKYESVQYSAWAELKVRNTGNDVTLEDVKVQIVELSQVFEEQGEKGSCFLHEPYPRWSPSNVYWSERNAKPNQLSLSISPNASSYALIAFHWDHGIALGSFNTQTRAPMLESKIVIEVSSKNSGIQRKAYYIEYHPPSRDEFEFVEWDLWCKSHNVNISEKSTTDKGDSQS